MSENVVAMPGVVPKALESETNEDAIAVLEALLADFRGGKLSALAVAATGPNDNYMRESAGTMGMACKLVGLAHVLLHAMEGKIAKESGVEP